MRYYEYDAQGWLVGWYEADAARPSSTQMLPLFPAAHSRWLNGTWTIDATREQQRDAEEVAARTQKQQAIATMKAYNPATATADQVRQTLGAALYLLRSVLSDLR